MKLPRAWRAPVLVAVLMVAVFSASFAWELHEAAPPAPGPTGGQFVLDQPAVFKDVLGVCASVTTCNAGAIGVLAYSSVYVFVQAKTGTAPSAINDSGRHTWTLERSVATGTAAEEYLYYTDNVSANNHLGVTVNFSASTIYSIGVLDIGNVTTKSLDTVGAGSASSSSATASDSVTTTVANDLVLIGISVGTNKGLTASGSDVLVQKGTVSSSYAGQFEQVDSSTGSITLSATIASATSWAAIAVALKASAVPSAPTGISTGSITTTTVPLTWTNPYGPDVNNTLYEAPYAGGSCGAYGTAFSLGAAHSYTVTGLTSGSVYCFQVTQWNSTGQSSGDTIPGVQTASVPGAVTGVTVSAVAGSTSSLKVTWTTPPQDTGILNYTIFNGTSSSCTALSSAVSFGSSGPNIYFSNYLSAGTTRYFTIEAWNATGGSSLSSCTGGTTYTTPGTPTSLGIAGTNETNVTLVWTQPSGTIVNDTLQYEAAACGPSWTKLSVGSVSKYVVTGLSPYQRYCFRVAAWSAGGEGSLSASINDTTLAGLPGQVTNLASTSQTTTSIALSWTNPSTSSGSLTNDTVDEGTSCGTWAQLISLGAAAGSYTVTGLTSGTSYCFAVGAWTQAGEGPLSSTLTVSTKNGLPAAPTYLTYQSSSRTTITVNWTNPSGVTVVNATVFYKASSSCSAANKANSTGGSTTSWTLSGLTAATVYCVVVAVWSSGGEGILSSTLVTGTQGATPPAPQSAHTILTGETWWNFAWTNPTGYTLYNNTVYYRTGSTCGSPWTGAISTNGVVASYNLTGLSSGTTYCVQITAWDAESNLSNVINTTTSGSGASGGGLLQLPGNLASAVVNWPWVIPAAALGIGLLIMAVVVYFGRSQRRRSAA